MKIALEHQALVLGLKDLGYAEAQVQGPSKQVVWVLRIDDIDYPLFFKIMGEGTMLQIVAFLPTRFEKTTASDTARLLHLINKEVDFPGFCIDEESSTLFFRNVIICPHRDIDSHLLKTVLSAIEVACKTFIHAIAAVSSGHLTMDQMLKQAKESQKK